MQKSPPYASRSNFYYLFAYKPWKLELPIAYHNHSHSPIQSNKRFKTQRMILDLNHASKINVSPRKKFRAIRQSNHIFRRPWLYQIDGNSKIDFKWTGTINYFYWFKSRKAMDTNTMGQSKTDRSGVSANLSAFKVKSQPIKIPSDFRPLLFQKSNF